MTAAADRSRPPAPAAVRPFRFPDFERHRLPTGLEVIVAPAGRAPLVSLDFLAPAGAARDPLELAGLAGFTASLLDAGTAGRAALEIAAAAESLGGALTTSAGWDVGMAAIQVEARHLEAGLALVAEVATRPSFPGEELERLRSRRLAELLRNRDQPDLQAGLWLARAIYGEGMRYGVSARGTEESIARIGRDDVEAFYRRCYPPAGSVLVAVGDLPPAAVLDDAAAALGGTAAPAPPAVLPAPPPGRRRVIVVDRPGGSQTELRLGQAAVPRHHPDFLRLKVMNTVLGGKFTSRLNLNLRERHGFTYGSFSALATRRGPGPFSVMAAVGNEVAGAAAREALVEIERLRQEAVPPDELEDARNYIVGTFPFGLQTVSGVGNHLAELAIYGLPDDYYRRFPGEIRAVTAEEVLAVAREHLRPEEMVLVAVGPAEVLRPQLAAFGEVEVVAPL